MRVRFYGTRGSIATPGKEYARYGGNTSCVLLTFDDGRSLILDAGTGLRELGNDMTGVADFQDEIFILLTHTHWDHIEGLRFFKPAYDPSRHITIITCGQERQPGEMEKAFEVHTRPFYFPVKLREMGARFTVIQSDTTSIPVTDGIIVEALRVPHPITTYSYRIEHGGKTIVYCTDVEYASDVNGRVVDFARGASLLIHDAQYTADELVSRKGWGHSTWEQAAEVAERASVSRLALFHHDPDHTDWELERIESDCRERFPDSFLAGDGMDLVI